MNKVDQFLAFQDELEKLAQQVPAQYQPQYQQGPQTQAMVPHPTYYQPRPKPKSISRHLLVGGAGALISAASQAADSKKSSDNKKADRGAALKAWKSARDTKKSTVGDRVAGRKELKTLDTSTKKGRKRAKHLTNITGSSRSPVASGVKAFLGAKIKRKLGVEGKKGKDSRSGFDKARDIGSRFMKATDSDKTKNAFKKGEELSKKFSKYGL